MTGRAAQLRGAARFASRLYAEQARGAYHAYVRRDPFTRLRFAPGREDPYPIYEQVRARGPFVRTPVGNLATADHAVCREILRSRRWGVQPEGEDPPGDPDLSFLDRNPPDHTRLRRLVAPAFSARRMAGLRAGVEKTVDRLLDDVEGAGGVDLVSSLAAPLPIAVICDLLGVPDADTAEFSRYGAAIGGALSGIRSLRHARELMVADAAIEGLFTGLFELRRREPVEDRPHDVISDLVRAQEAGRLEAREMVPLCSLLLIAGFETTVNLVGNAVDALLDHPDQWAALVADPPALAAAGVQETLRWDPPVQRTARVSFDDTEVAGISVPRGGWVNVLIGGANRDPQVFIDPAVFDLARTDGGEHLAFSSGIHHCVGRPLAELEATVVLQRLAERMPRMRRTGRVRRRNATLIRGPQVLPVTG